MAAHVARDAAAHVARDAAAHVPRLIPPLRRGALLLAGLLGAGLPLVLSSTPRPEPAAASVVSASVPPAFTEVSRSVGVRHVCLDPHRICGGVAIFDFDGDGWEDLYLTGGHGPDRLYRNLGGGTFEDVTIRAGLGFLAEIPTMGVVTGDVDNDGWRDILVTTDDGHHNVLLRNRGDGTFEDISRRAGLHEVPAVWSTAASFGDYDLDGWLDLYVTNNATYDALPYDENLTGGIEDFLFRNQRDGTFRPVRLPAGNPDGAGLAVAFTDYDGDARPDIYVGNDFGFLFGGNVLLRNDGDGLFEDVSAATGTGAEISSMGIAAGDYDGDGRLDYYVSNMGPNVLYRSRADGSFRDVAADEGLEDRFSTGWGTAFIDYDNDGRLDLLLANGRVLPRYRLDQLDHRMRLLQKHQNRLWRWDGRAFTEVSQAAGIADTTRGRGLAIGDLDGDGALDFVVAVATNREREARVLSSHALVYRNVGEWDGAWLKVRLRGTRSNRDAFGSRIRVVAAGRSWIREVDGGSSYMSQSSSTVHFGLGEVTRADSLVVTWPGGRRDVRLELPVNATVRVVEGTTPAGGRP